MMRNKNGRRKGTVVVPVIAVLIILVPLGYSLVRAVTTPALDAVPFLERPGPEHKSCVRDTEYMRYHHWELLRGIRKEVVRYGIRTDVGLDRCKDCHTSRERFCNRCHDATSLTPDCFDCHYYP